MTYFGWLVRYLPFLDQDEDHSMENKNQKSNTNSSYIMQSIFWGVGGEGCGELQFSFFVLACFTCIILSNFNIIINNKFAPNINGSYHFELGTDQLLTITEKVCTNESVHSYWSTLMYNKKVDLSISCRIYNAPFPEGWSWGSGTSSQ